MQQGDASQQGPRMTMRTKAEQEAVRLLTQRNYPFGSTNVEKKKASSSALQPRGKVDVTTNVYQINMNEPKTVHQYHLQITGHHRKRDGTETTIQLSGVPCNNDYMKSKRRVDCRTILNAASEQNPEVFTTLCAYYDLASLLYTMNPLKLPPDSVITIEGQPLEMLTVNGFQVVRVKFDYTKHFDVADLKHVSGTLSEENKFLEQFLNIATGQDVFYDSANFLTFSASRGYIYNPTAFGFDPDDLIVFSSNNSFLGMGFGKSVRVIEGSKQLPTGIQGCNGSTGLVVEHKKTPFHTSEPLIVKVRALLNLGADNDLGQLSNDQIGRLTTSLKGLYVLFRTTYRRAYFSIHSISSKNSMNCMIQRENGDEISLNDYYQMKRQITLTYPMAPLVQTMEAFRGQRQRNYYPIELLVVCEDQRVKGNQATPEIIQDILKLTTVPPDVLKTQIGYTKNALKLSDQSAFLTAIGVNVNNEALDVKADVISPPTLAYSDKDVQVNLQKSTWFSGKFFQPMNLYSWAIYTYNRERESINEEELKTFKDRFIAECATKGIVFREPNEMGVYNSEQQDLKNHMFRLKHFDCKFVLVIHPDKAEGDRMHAMLKLMEQQTGIVTQGLKIQTVKKILGGSATVTLQNIIQKTNVKIGGLNFTLSMVPPTPEAKLILDGETLFIGLGINHPGGGLGLSDDVDETPHRPKKPITGNGNQGNGNVGNGNNIGNGNANGNNAAGSSNGLNGLNGLNGMKPPSVIGFSANITAGNPFGFCGGYDFQEFRRDAKVENIAKIIAYCVQRYHYHKKQFPKRIVIYRNGCGEGQFPFVLSYEVPMIKSELKGMGIGIDIPITYIVPNKLQGIRFFRKKIRADARSAAEKGLEPGTVIHDTITHPCITEFHLNSHHPLHGTARIPIYSVLVDENNFSLEELENLTYTLCYGHQIVNLPTSIPSPVYIAEEYAKRGRNVYTKWMTENGNGVNHANVKQYGDLMKIIGHQFIDSLNSRRVNA